MCVVKDCLKVDYFGVKLGQSFPTQRWSLLVVLQVFYQVVLESNNVVLCRVSLKTTMFVLIDAAL